jgi:hypothetical protein
MCVLKRCKSTYSQCSRKEAENKNDGMICVSPPSPHHCSPWCFRRSVANHSVVLTMRHLHFRHVVAVAGQQLTCGEWLSLLMHFCGDGVMMMMPDSRSSKMMAKVRVVLLHRPPFLFPHFRSPPIYLRPCRLALLQSCALGRFTREHDTTTFSTTTIPHNSILEQLSCWTTNTFKSHTSRFGIKFPLIVQ